MPVNMFTPDRSASDDRFFGAFPFREVLSRRRPVFSPGSEDVERVRFILSRRSLPQELVTPILDLAEYWAYSKETCLYDPHDLCFKFKFKGGEFPHPLRRLVITLVPEGPPPRNLYHFRGVTCFFTTVELALDDEETDGETLKMKTTFLVPRSSWRCPLFQAIIKDEKILRRVKKGKRLSVRFESQMRCAQYLAHIKDVEIETGVAY